ncbi:MAG: hypothetical protein ACRDNK_09325 [Solirubrobacteraceae bacterium]
MFSIVTALVVAMVSTVSVSNVLAASATPVASHTADTGFKCVTTSANGTGDGVSAVLSAKQCYNGVSSHSSVQAASCNCSSTDGTSGDGSFESTTWGSYVRGSLVLNIRLVMTASGTHSGNVTTSNRTGEGNVTTRPFGSIASSEFSLSAPKGFVLQITQTSQPSLGASSSATQCEDESFTYVEVLAYNDQISGQVCWNGSAAWTNYLSGSCSVWVPGPPGTSCESYYTYEQGRGTYWDYPNGVFHEALLFGLQQVCDHLYIENKGNQPAVFGRRYGC